MALNTTSARPQWLTDELVEDMKKEVIECPNPYTEADVAALELDGDMDIKRYNAYVSKSTLTEYGLL